MIGYGSPQPIINKLIAKPAIDENLYEITSSPINARPNLSPIRMNKRGLSNFRPTIHELNPKRNFGLTKDFVKNGIQTASIGFDIP